MCLSIPGKIIELEGILAKVDVVGNVIRADVSLIDDPQVGEFVLVHAGYAITKVMPEDAAETLALLKELGVDAEPA